MKNKIIFRTLLLITCLYTAPFSVSAQETPPPVQCRGPKFSVAVEKFGSTGKLAALEGYDVGQGIAAQFMTALMTRGCFNVLDRLGLAATLREIELNNTRVVNKESPTPAANVAEARYILRGEVTVYEPVAKSGGASLTIGLPFFNVTIGGGQEKQTAVITLSIRVTDASTNQLITSFPVTANADTEAYSGGFENQYGGFKIDSASKHPLGQAIASALGAAVGDILKALMALPVSEYTLGWRVAEVHGTKIILTANQSDGIKIGDRFRVSSLVKELRDPVTRKHIGNLEQDVGEIEIVEVTNGHSIGVRRSGVVPKPGNFARFIAEDPKPVS